MADGEVVERLVVEFDAKIDKILTKLNNLNRSVHGSAAEIERTFGSIKIDEALDRVFSSSKLQVLDSGAEKLGVFGKALEPLGALGLGAAAGIGAIGLAIEQSIKAAEWAENLEMVSKKLGITTTALQEFDFIATASGVPIESMRESLGGLEAKIGQVQAGVAKAQTVKLFEALDISPDQLRHMGDLQTILPVIAEKLRELPAAEREGLAARLDVTPILPALLKGKEGLADLTAEAHRYGIVVDEDVVKRSAEAAEKLKVAGDIIDKNLKAAFADLAPAIAGASMELAKFVHNMVSGLSDPKVLRFLSMMNKPIGMFTPFDASGAIDNILNGQLNVGLPLDKLKLGADPAKGETRVTELLKQLDRKSAGHAARASAVSSETDDGSAARAAEGQKLIASSIEEELRAREALTNNANDRLALAIKLIDIETQAKIKANEDLVAKGKLSQADADAANLMIGIAAAERQQALQKARADKIEADAAAKAAATSEATKARMAEVQTAYKNAISGALDAAIHGGWPGLARYMGQMLEQHLVDAIANALTNQILGGGSNGGIFGMLFSSLFGLPKFATGTDSAPGGWSIVGEKGPELLNLKQGSQVVPNGLLRGLPNANTQMGGGNMQVISFDLRGAVMTEDLLAQMDRMANQAGQQATLRGAALGAQVARQTIPSDIGRSRRLSLV